MPKNNLVDYIREQMANSTLASQKDSDLAQKKQVLGYSRFATKKYKFPLFQIIYGDDNGAFDVEIENEINEFFADLFDPKEIKWTIKNPNGQNNAEITKIFKKYLNQTNFHDKLWLGKCRAAAKNYYAFVIQKQMTNQTDSDGVNYTKPIIMLADVIYLNRFNDDIITVAVSYNENFWLGNNYLWALADEFSVADNKVMLYRSVWNLTETNKRSIRKFKKDVNNVQAGDLQLGKRKIEQKFIPVAILRTDPKEQPRMARVYQRLRTINFYDENLAILPAWERGGIIKNTSEPENPNNSLENREFMKALLFNGFVESIPNLAGQVTTSLAQELVPWQPISVMQTMQKTRNDMYNKIKDALGIPHIDDVSSAQKNSIYAFAEQFLTSPRINREKNCYIDFLQDFGKKFLMSLKENYLPEWKKLEPYDLEQFEIIADLNLTTDKNISATVKMMSGTLDDENKKPTESEEQKNE